MFVRVFVYELRILLSFVYIFLDGKEREMNSATAAATTTLGWWRRRYGDIAIGYVLEMAGHR